MNLVSHYTPESANKFLRLKETPNLSFLIYRDIFDLLKKYPCHGKALDFGCGPGLSTRFVADLGFEVIGVDINKNMLKEALSQPDGIPFAWIKHGKIPFKNDSFDLVFSVMVLLEMPSLQNIQEAVNEIARVLKPGGFFLAVVGSENFHKYAWLNKDTVDIDNYQNLRTGDVFYTYSKTTDITFKDYYYTEQDYIDIFNKANLKLFEIHKALGRSEDGMPWELEKSLNPFTHYVCSKS